MDFYANLLIVLATVVPIAIAVLLAEWHVTQHEEDER